MSFFGFPFRERFNYTCKVQTFLEAENISSYVSGFLAVLQLFTQLWYCIPRSQYSCMWRDCLCCWYSYRAKFLNGSASFLLHIPLVILRYGVYLSCSRDAEQSCNILHSCFEKALWTLRKLSGPLWAQHCHAGAWLDITTKFEIPQVLGRNTVYWSQDHSKPVGQMHAWLCLLHTAG